MMTDSPISNVTQASMTLWPEFQSIFEQKLADFLASTLQACPKSLYQAIAYSLLSPGKRFRPQLILASCQLCQLSNTVFWPLAIAMECLHTYSLVHDDLPCMDDDDVRRAQPSCHKKFNEATAVLVGDVLQGLAFEAIATTSALSHAEKTAVTLCLCKAVGANGMAGGQYLDLHPNHSHPDEKKPYV